MFSSFMGLDQFALSTIFNDTDYLIHADSLSSINSSFANNSYFGVAFALQTIDSILNIHSTEFDYSNSLGTGGAIYAIDSFVAINASTFKKFIRSHNGGVIVCFGGRISIRATTFEHNAFEGKGRVLYANSTDAVIEKSLFRFNNALIGGVLSLHWGTVTINGSEFNNNIANNMTVGARSGAVVIERANVSISNSKFESNIAKLVCFGGHISILATTFEHNVAEGEGGVLYANSSDVIIEESIFRFNNALVGSVLSFHWGKVIINRSKFYNNIATGGARGGIMVTKETIAIVNNSKFDNNSGGAVECYHCKITLSNIGFHFNYAAYKGILYVYKSNDLILSNLIFENNVGKRGIIYVVESRIFFKLFSYNFNTGSIITLRGRLQFSDMCMFSKNIPEHLTNASGFYSPGGVITSFQSTIVFVHYVKFIDNYGRFGGAIYAVETLINVEGDLLLSENKAVEDGGGMYLYMTEIQIYCNLTLTHNLANNSGGGIYIVGSSLNILPNYLRRCPTARMSMLDNSASYGGGIFLSNHAKLYIFRGKDNEMLKLMNNHADYGGGVYVADDTNTGICYALSDNHYHVATSNSECFFQNLVFDHHVVSYNKSTLNERGFFQFQNNTATYTGSNLFGGLLDRCSLNPYGNPFLKDINTGPDSYLEYLNRGSVDLDSISSLPVKMCLCDDNQPDCNRTPSIVYVKKGELFNISAVAVDQVNHTVNATVHCNSSSHEAGLGEGQLSQLSFEECTFLKFQIKSPFEEENLALYADGPCKDARLSRLSIPVKFLPCTCPVGFQPIRSKRTSCECECDYRLQDYGISCNESGQSIIRKSSYWISHIKMNENVSGFIYYANCPYDYCLPPSFKYNIDLNISKGEDAQCAFNRTGVLCGSCKPGLSLSLGSSQCLVCPATWPISMFFILVGAALAGVLLVVLILILNLTVAAGTINGFIFYANIIGANSRSFLPFVRPNFCTVFIAWFNLEFGFDLCFFEGMDAYAKTWLQLSFPVYLFLIIGAVIFISNHSSKFSRLIGKKNPVATLATLILLAFTKFLRTTIVIFSFAVLKYPNNTNNVLWLLDASVEYLKGKHLPLFIVAKIIIIADFFFILLLFSWQLILYASNLKIMKWSRNTRIQNFMDSYLAPYVPKFRFWTGLLLLARVIIYLVSTINVSGDPVVDLIAVGVVMTFIFLLKVLSTEKVYQKLSTELLETACYFNIFLFTIVSFLSLKSPWHQRIFAQISVGITFAAFTLIFIYHLFFSLRQLNLYGRLVSLRCSKRQNKTHILGQ